MSKPMPAPWPHMLVCFELEGDVYTDKVTAARADEEGNTVFTVAQHPGWRIDWTPWAVREVRSSSGAVLWRRDPPALPVEMPEPMPGMIMETTKGHRASVGVCMRMEDGTYAITCPELLGEELFAWTAEDAGAVYSAAGTLLWQRPNLTSEEK